MNRSEKKFQSIEREKKFDSRGYLVELLKNSNVYDIEFGQMYLSVAYPGKIKGNHYHTKKTEWFYIIQGTALLIMYEKKTGKKTELVLRGEKPQLICIPPMVVHALKNIGTDDLYILAYTEKEEFDSNNPDTFQEEIIT